MKKKLIAVGLSLVLTLSMSFTAMAASSSTDSNSGNQEESSSSSTPAASASVATPSNPKPVATVVAEKKAGEEVQAAAVQVSIASPNGTVSAVTLDKVVSDAQSTLTSAVAASSPAQAVATVQALMTTAPTPFFAQTVEALTTMKGSSVVVNDCGTVKTAAVAKDAMGNNIASAGVIKNVTSGALIMLMSVNADGTIEYVEGVVDPVTGAVIGAFKGVPAVITVLVLA